MEAKLAADLKTNIAKVIVGKDEVVELLLTAILANGHVLLEDVPGTGKTLMASEGYKVRWEAARRNITYTTPSGWQCRDRLLFGEKYLKENMEYEFRMLRTESFALARTVAACDTAYRKAGSRESCP